MRTIISETVAYQYSELSDAAKERVREDNNRHAWEMGGLRDDIREYAKEMFAAIGLELTNLEYDLDSQGGEPRFSVSGTIGEDFHVATNTHHYYGTSVEWWVGDDEYADNAQPEVGAIFVRELMDAMSAAIQSVLESEDEYVSSDEYAAEMADANGYEYDENGDMI